MDDDLYEWIVNTHTQCRAGDGKACYDLGKFYKTGAPGVDPNLEFSKKYFERGCDNGDGRSCVVLSLAESDNPTVSEDYRHKAKTNFLLGCTEKNDPNECYLFASFIISSENIDEYPRAIHALERGCELGDDTCCVYGGSYLADNDYKYSDIPRGLKLLQNACDRKDGHGCFALAEAISNISPNEESKISDLYKKSCDLGYAEGCFSHAAALIDSKKYSKALETIFPLCEKEGNAKACTGSGVIYSYLNKPEDARRLYQKACVMGDENACQLLKESQT